MDRSVTTNVDLLEIANTEHLGMNALIYLPKPDSVLNQLEIGPYQKSPNRLLRFLAQEGFLDCLDELSNEDVICPSKPVNGWDVYRNLHVNPSYEDAQCVPMRLFMVPREEDDNEFVKKSVENLLLGIDSKLIAKVAPQTRERLIYKLRVALQEVIHNSQEHAYERDNGLRSLVIYVRYRTGGLGLNITGKKLYKKCVLEERKFCPKLAEDWLTARPGCLEMFVLDRGMGMVRSFEKAGISLNHKYKFNEVMRRTFIKGDSTKPERQTLYGGLHLLYNLLSETGDFLRALENSVWFGCGVPILRETQTTQQLTENQGQIQGLAMHLRLGWKEETDYDDRWLQFKQGKQSEVWQELTMGENDCVLSFNWFEDQIVLDERFGELKNYGRKSEWILWLVRPHRMKWDILTFIERKISPIVTENTVLIIADIPSYEAETYAAALSEFKAPGIIDWPTKFSQILLSTNRWRFALVDYQKHLQRHGFSRLHDMSDTPLIVPPPIEPRPKNIRLAIVRWLKWHDSRRLWEEVKQRGTMFIPEHVTWENNEIGDAKTIQGYLDFPQTTHNDLCAAIYRVALSRVLGVIPSNEFMMYPLDRLTMTVLREIHSAEIYEPSADSPGNRLALGSVLVTGSTLKSSSSQELDLHFFIHYSSLLRGKKPSLLFWLPKIKVNDELSKLARVGKTATIASEGWKSFEVPRFDDERKCVGARNPENTYKDWQDSNPVIVKAGHWSYEGHHDFLTVNIASAVEAAFLAKNDLASFLASRILPFIGLNEEHIDKNWVRLLERQQSDSLTKDPNTAGYGLLVYRSHPSSESVIHRLLDLLTFEGRELALSRIFPILPIRMRWSGSTLLIPPLVRESIKKAINQGNRALPVLLFDDATVTGRTLHDLRATLSAIGATNIDTMVIANRLRQPADGHGNERLDYYWRLDLPVMGREGNCPLCHTLHLAEAFSSSLAANNAKKEISDWRHRWGAISPLDNWSGGLRPLPLGTLEMKVKYCYRQNMDVTSNEEKHLARIDLIRSTGLTINVAELHAMTGRDDYCLKKIIKHPEPEIRVELAASQLLLFGNEFDMEIRVELVQVLIRELALLKEGSLHTPLAILTVIGGLGLVDKVTRRQAAKAVHENGWGTRSNYVTKILLAYLVSEELIENTDSVAYKIGKSLLSTASLSLSQRFNAWFLEILSPIGNAHSEAIPLLIDELTKGTIIEDVWIKDALDSLDFLSDIESRLEKTIVRKEVSETYQDKMNNMKKSGDILRKLLVQGIEEEKDESWHKKTKSALLVYLKNMKSIACAYFHRIPSAKEYYRNRTFETIALAKIISRIDWEKASTNTPGNTNDRTIKFSLTGEINFDCNAEEIWIPWHRFIAGIVMDLLRNAVYANRQIGDPWDSTRSDTADLWVCVDYGEKLVELTLANASTCNREDIISRLKQHRWSYLKDLGGKVMTINLPQNGVLGVRVQIPYAAYLE